jgi:hypothetical protein
MPPLPCKRKVKIITTGRALAVFPLSFKQVTVLLGSLHLIEMSRISALQSRIKDFQRREFPPGLNTGKGKAAAYTPEHIILLTFAFEMLELGMTPDKICVLLRYAATPILFEVAEVCRTGRPALLKRNKTVVYFDPRGLSDLREGKDFEGGAPGIFIGTIADMNLALTRREGSTRLAVIDLFRLVIDITIGLEGAVGCSADEATRALVEWAFDQ